eukprot:10559179-Lingulodinium_polyedra.AAC.1
MSRALATSRRFTASKIAPSVSASRWSRVPPTRGGPGNTRPLAHPGAARSASPRARTRGAAQ